MKREKQFHKINVEISNICNLSCSFCPEILRSKQIMNLGLFERIVSQIAPLTDQVCLHLMGDPLVHPRLEEIIQICQIYQLPVFIVSNGLLLREKQKDSILSSIVRQINFSLHSFSDNFPQTDPTAYLQKIFRFIEEAFNQRPDLYINLRLWNLREFSLSKYAVNDDADINRRANMNMLKEIENYFGWNCPPEMDVRRRKSAQIKNRLYLHLDSQFIWPDLELPILGSRGTCYGLDSHIGILVDGTVVPCCLDKEGVIALGNISEQSLEEILSGPRARAMKLGFQKHILNEELCKRCQYIERFQSTSVAKGSL